MPDATKTRPAKGTATVWHVTLRPGETLEVRDGTFFTNRGRGTCQLIIEVTKSVED